MDEETGAQIIRIVEIALDIVDGDATRFYQVMDLPVGLFWRAHAYRIKRQRELNEMAAENPLLALVAAMRR